MRNSVGIYNLKSTQPRRAGLTRSGHKGPSLLRTINVPNTNIAITMPPRSKATVESRAKEDVTAPPLSSDRDESADEREISADIQPSLFKRASEEPQPQVLNGNSGFTKASIARGSSLNSNNITSTSVAKGTKNIRSSSKGMSPNSSVSSSSPKRKSQEDQGGLGKGMEDAFGRVLVKKKKTKTFGSSKSRIGSSQSLGTSKVNHKDPTEDDSPKTLFKKPPTIDSSPSPSGPKFIKHDLDDILSSQDAASPIKQMKIYSPLYSPQKEERDEASVWRDPNMSGLNKSPKNDSVDSSELRDPFNTSFDSEFPSLSAVSPSRYRRERTSLLNRPSANHLSLLSTFGVDGETVGNIKDIIAEDKDVSNATTYEDDDLFMTNTQKARCPMCNKPVDPDDLRAFGDMNTRQEEKFCRSHQRKSAKEDWESHGYPEIDWENLDSRISTHHSFIKEVVKGAESHYRRALADIVKAGKDRNLMKMTSNLTPGYYGSRGLRAISENLMQKFSPLLKKMAIQDRLISARGPTAFVQSVLVPEVTVRLIMEDMKVEIEEARKILTDSVGVGELVHEEIRDVVMRHVEDSEEDDEDDD